MTTALEHLEPIGREECLRLLEAHGVGRVGFGVQSRPVIYPVNYALADESIIFLTRPGSDLDRATEGALVAFEIDSANFVYHEGWSVLVVGRSAHVSDPSALKRARALSLTAWAGEERTVMVRIVLDQVSGRRITLRARDTGAAHQTRRENGGSGRPARRSSAMTAPVPSSGVPAES
jgi:hypothetical protein